MSRLRARSILLLALAGTVVLVVAADEGELLRAIKSDVFDQNWDAVLANCDEFIAGYRSSPTLPRVYYYRAQALESMGRPEEAIDAYGRFLERFPNERGALKEDANLSRITLATALVQKGDRAKVRILMEGMDADGYPKIYAAIQASKIDHSGAHSKALPILKPCARSESDVELRSECKVALLRFAPKEDLADLGSSEGAGRSASPAGEVKLIRVEVFDKRQSKITVRVNLPIAFAELFLDALGQHYSEQILPHMFPDAPKGSVPDLHKFWDAIRDGGAQTLVEVDGEAETIKVWVE